MNEAKKDEIMINRKFGELYILIVSWCMWEWLRYTENHKLGFILNNLSIIVTRMITVIVNCNQNDSNCSHSNSCDNNNDSNDYNDGDDRMTTTCGQMTHT